MKNINTTSNKNNNINNKQNNKTNGVKKMKKINQKVLKEIVNRIPKAKKQNLDESNTKSGLIEPLLTLLGYDVHNTEEVIKEYTADIGIKEGEKVDYKVATDKDLFIIEAKRINNKLEEKEKSQLYRYFSLLPIKIGILTNGRQYIFFTTGEDGHLMDPVPFFTFNMEEFTDDDIEMLARFHKDVIDIDTITNIAQKAVDEKKIELKKIETEMYLIVHEIKKEYKEQLIQFEGLKPEKAEENAINMVQTLVAIKKLGDEGIIKNPDTIEDCILVPVREKNVYDKVIHARFGEIQRFAYGGHEEKGIPEIKIETFSKNIGHLNIPDTIKNNEQFFKNRTFKASEEIEKALEGYKNKINPIYKHILRMCEFDFTTDINDDMFGNIFERIMDEEERHDTGATYTPKIITTTNSEYTICKYLSNGETENIKELTEKYNKNPKKLITKLHNLKILDPACGSGNFLLGVVDVLTDLYKFAYNKAYGKECDNLKINQKIIKENIYGVDKNKGAIEIAKLSIYLKVITSEHKEHYKIEDIGKHIKAADTLLDFPEEFGKFDIIIGNPPYVRHELIKELKPELKEKYEVYHGRGDLYIYFFEKAIKLLKENGIMSFICSNTYTNAGFAKKLRAFMLENTILKYNDHTDEKLFNAAVNTSSIFIQKNKPTKDHEILIDNKYNIKQSTITEEGFFFDEKTIKLQQIKIKPETYKIEEICFVTSGMKLDGTDENGNKFTKKDLISEIKDDVHTHEYIEPKDIEKYGLKRIRYLEYNSPRVPDKISKKSFKELYTIPEKILTNAIGEFKTTYDTNQLLTEHTTIHCSLWKYLEGINNRSIGNVENRKEKEELSEKYNTKYITAILNSPIGTLLLNQIRGNDKHIYTSHIKQIPIAKADIETQNKIAEQVDIMMDKDASNNAKANAEATINKTIYEIYQLTEEEIAIINDNY